MPTDPTSRPSGVARLGTEKISKLLWEMSSQTTFSLMVYAIYSITDTYFLSVGINSLAAAGASIISPVLIGLGGVATIVGVGGASLVSRALGEQDVERASTVVANTHLIFWAAAITITILGTLFIEPIVYRLGATESVAPYAITYGRIIFLGALTSTGFSAIIRADGSIRYSTAIWVIPVFVNVILSWLFIMVLQIGAGGAALATVAGQAVSAGMSFYFFFVRPSRTYRIKLAYFRPRRAIISEVLMIGLPSFLKNLSAALIVIVTNNLLKGLGGDSALGVYAIISKLYAALNMPQTGIMQGMQPIIGYNFGQKRFERVGQTIRLALSSSVVYGLLVCAFSLLFPTALISLFSQEAAIIAEGRSALQLLSLSYPVSGISLIIAAYFQSVGKAKEALAITLGGILLVKLPVLLLASRLFSLNGIWVSEAVSELLLGILAMLLLVDAQKKMTPVEPATQPVV